LSVSDLSVTFVDHKFSVKKVSEMTGFAERSIWRFLQSKGIRIRDKFSSTDSEQLLQLVGGICSENENLGEIISKLKWQSSNVLSRTLFQVQSWLLVG
jgi:hypothetical protein